MQFIFILATFLFVAVNCNSIRRISHNPANKTKEEKNDEKAQLIREITSELIKQMPKPVNVQVVNIETCCNGTKKGEDWMKNLMNKINNEKKSVEKKPNKPKSATKATKAPRKKSAPIKASSKAPTRSPAIKPSTHGPAIKPSTHGPAFKPSATETPEFEISTTEVQKIAPPIKCQEPDAKFDICFLIDESASVGENEYEKEKKFLANFVNDSHFNVGPDKTRFCLIEFSDTAEIRHKLTETVSKLQVQKTIFNQSYDGATTNIFAALEAAHQELLNNRRDGVPQLVILLTDGVHNEDGDPIEAAKKIKNDGIQIFSVGVTDSINKDDLEEISGSKDRLMVVDDFDQLVNNVAKIVKNVCNDDKNDKNDKIVG